MRTWGWVALREQEEHTSKTIRLSAFKKLPQRAHLALASFALLSLTGLLSSAFGASNDDDE
eukprot:752157-Hanusia_phi.AAC.2